MADDSLILPPGGAAEPPTQLATPTPPPVNTPAPIPINALRTSDGFWEVNATSEPDRRIKCFKLTAIADSSLSPASDYPENLWGIEKDLRVVRWQLHYYQAESDSKRLLTQAVMYVNARMSGSRLATLADLLKKTPGFVCGRTLTIEPCTNTTPELWELCNCGGTGGTGTGGTGTGTGTSGSSSNSNTKKESSGSVLMWVMVGLTAAILLGMIIAVIVVVVRNKRAASAGAAAAAASVMQPPMMASPAPQSTNSVRANAQQPVAAW